MIYTDNTHFPKHVAIIPDGNRRWAKRVHMPAVEGHRRGADLIVRLMRHAKKRGVKVLSVWGFSTENWKRMDKEIAGLMGIFEQGIRYYFKEMVRNRMRFIHMGRKDRLSDSLRSLIKQTEEETKHFTSLYFLFGLDYGGRNEMIRAINTILTEKRKLGKNGLTEESFAQFLDTKDAPVPFPDMVIRTGGEQRTSGFMIWQTEYAEWIFRDILFPDFSEKEFDECLDEYLQRQRRFGR